MTSSLHLQVSDELSLRVNDVVRVVERASANWWLGELPDGRRGVFPSNFVINYDDDDTAGSYDEGTFFPLGHW